MSPQQLLISRSSTAALPTRCTTSRATLQRCRSLRSLTAIRLISFWSMLFTKVRRSAFALIDATFRSLENRDDCPSSHCSFNGTRLHASNLCHDTCASSTAFMASLHSLFIHSCSPLAPSSSVLVLPILFHTFSFFPKASKRFPRKN